MSATWQQQFCLASRKAAKKVENMEMEAHVMHDLLNAMYSAKDDISKYSENLSEWIQSICYQGFDPLRTNAILKLIQILGGTSA